MNGYVMKQSTITNRHFSKQLRYESTDVERMLWYHLRGRRLNAIKFRRQAIIGNYIVDFISYEKRLIIELDGGQHNDNKMYDLIRTKYLNSRGFKVMRFWNNDVIESLDSVLNKILDQ